MGKKARTFGEDLMKGQGKVKPKRGEASRARDREIENRASAAAAAGQIPAPAPENAIPAGLLMGKIENYDGAERTISGTSIFDPVLCELAYRWFCPPGGMILDPFAGGSVRGVVAAKLGRRYFGVDLRPEQVEANRMQAAVICKELPKAMQPQWAVGDSRAVLADMDNCVATFEADFIFSCPPYADLEVYSDNPLDISTMKYPEFRAALQEIIGHACELLKPDRFACFIVGDARNSKGAYYGIPYDTVDGFRRAGLELYNEAILVTAAGSLPIRAAKQFEKSRKLGKMHQNILVFVKGDPVKATEAIGEIEFGALEGVDEDPESLGEAL